jgi:hypothetical protein
MTLLLPAMTLLATTFMFTGSAPAANPVIANALKVGVAPKGQGFTRKGMQGVGLYGTAGRRQAQQFAPPTMPTTYYGASQYRPQLQYGLQYGGLQYGLQYGLRYPMQYGLQVRHPLTIEGEIETENGTIGGVMGNPANSFAPAGAYGFGPGAIFGW